MTFLSVCGFILRDVLYDQMLLGKYFSQLRLEAGLNYYLSRLPTQGSFLTGASVLSSEHT